MESESPVVAQGAFIDPPAAVANTAAATTVPVVVPAAAVPVAPPADNTQIPAAASVKPTDPFDRTASNESDIARNAAGVAGTTQSSNLPKIRIRPAVAARRKASLPDSGQTGRETMPTNADNGPNNDLARQAPAGDHDINMAPAHPLPTTDSNGPGPAPAAAPQTAKQPPAVGKGSLADVPDPFPPQAPDADMEPDEDDEEGPASSKKGKGKGKKVPKVKAPKEVKLMKADANSVTAR